MKKGKIILLFLIFFFGMMGYVNAAYYYENDNGNYMLCEGSSPGCHEITKGQSGVTFDLSHGEIIYNGETYYYDSIKEEEHKNEQNGITRMYYYLDKSERYYLCKTEKSCQRYTFDQLVSKGATIVTGDRVIMNNENGPGEEGDIFYYSLEKQSEYDSKNNVSNNNNTTGGNSDNDNINNNVALNPTTDYCTRLKEPLKFIGNIVVIVKIVLPLIIIGFGIYDFFKATVGSKDEEIKKSARSFAFRCAAGVIIFLIPTVVSLIFSLVDSWMPIKGDFNACQKCVLRVSECQ